VHSTFHQAFIFNSIHLVFSVTQQSGVKSRIPPPPPTNVVQLDVHNFDSVALVRDSASLKQMFFNLFLQDSSKNVLVTFTVTPIPSVPA
jgi:hypothetical protein